ncbi:hypothetical protein E6H18_11015 [Candidatus Bathyarchaeota archaeon]|nr:MAG: hypothetical protein E6H18_11015 [Candidatus Bathyarchaeota archaeon]
MARSKKYRWGEDPSADVVQVGKLAAKGLGKLSSLVRSRAADRSLPEDLQRLKIIIEGFRPAKRFDREIRYQDELYGYLLGRLGQGVAIEKQRGRSRPDIVVDEIAIEIKGPTTNQGLQTIADKIARYRLHFSGIVCVLFDVQDETHFQEWLRGIQDPGVLVIRIF